MPRWKRKAEGAKGAQRLVSTERAIAALELQARFWDERAQDMRDAVESMRRQLREAERGFRGTLPARGSGAPARRGGRRGRGPRGAGAGAIVAEILRGWSRPARVGELLPELERRGIRVGGKNPMATLASTLLKYGGVKRAGRGLFIAADGGGSAAATEGAKPKRRGPGRPKKKAAKESAAAAE